MTRAIPLFALLSLFVSATALADIPPPPYVGPTQATLGGLRFERGKALRPPGRPGRRSNDAVLLQGCERRSRNCDAATRAHVIGWRVEKIDGEWLYNGEVADLIRAFAPRRRSPVKLLLQDASGETDHEVEVVLSVR